MITGQDECPDCRCKVWEHDSKKHEFSCRDCGFVVDDQPMVADANQIHGDGRCYERPSRGRQHGTTLLSNGPLTHDHNGARISPENRQLFQRLKYIHERHRKLSEPMYHQVKDTIEELFGKWNAMLAEPFVEASTKRLSREREEHRKTLSKNLKKRLSLPKTSFTRTKKGSKGSSDLQNMLILAMAIYNVMVKWIGLEAMAKVHLVEEYGITKNQLNTAQKRVERHYLARVELGWAPCRSTLLRKSSQKETEERIEAIVKDKRADETYQAMVLAEKYIRSYLPKESADIIQQLASKVIRTLKVPSPNGPISSMRPQKAVGGVYFALLRLHGFARRRQTSFSKHMLESTTTIQNAIKEFNSRYDAGELEEAAALFIHSDGQSEKTKDGEPTNS